MPVAPASILCTSALMAGHVDKANNGAIGARPIGEAEIDGNAARFLLLEAVCVDAS